MSPRLRAALYPQAGAVFSLYPCLYVGDRPTASRSRLQLFFQVTPPSVHQMVITPERNGLIRRRPGTARSIEVLVDPAALPALRASHDQPVNPSVQRY